MDVFVKLLFASSFLLLLALLLSLLVLRQATFALSTISRSRLSCALRFRQLM
jgi:hypothetical protein